MEDYETMSDGNMHFSAAVPPSLRRGGQSRVGHNSTNSAAVIISTGNIVQVSELAAEGPSNSRWCLALNVTRGLSL